MSQSQAVANTLFYPPLGLPLGSVRAILSLLIGGAFWIMFLFSRRAEEIPLYLYFLLALLLLFFTAHGYTIASSKSDHPSPWWLPRGFFRAVIVLGFVLTAAYKYTQAPGQLLEALTPSAEQLGNFPYLMLAVGIGFTIGRLIRMGPWEQKPWLLDVQAWVALLAMTALVVQIFLILFVQPAFAFDLDLSLWEYLLTGIVTCYFAIRC